MTGNIEWGPEIRVDGKRPAWLANGVPMRWAGVTKGGSVMSYMPTRSEECVNWNPDGNGCYIRLPADHPHYRQPTTPERDPALWDRMEALVRRIGKGFYMHGANDIGISSYEAVALAEGIVRDLPKPVDPDLIEAREIAAGLSKPNAFISFSAGERSADLTREGHMDDSLLVQGMLAAIKRGRELAGEQA